MATIPNLAPQPQPGASRLGINMEPDKVTFVIDLGNGAAISQGIDNGTMLGLFANFMKVHPELVPQFVKQIRELQAQEMDIIRTVQKSKNG